MQPNLSGSYRKKAAVGDTTFIGPKDPDLYRFLGLRALILLNMQIHSCHRRMRLAISELILRIFCLITDCYARQIPVGRTLFKVRRCKATANMTNERSEW